MEFDFNFFFVGVRRLPLIDDYHITGVSVLSCFHNIPVILEPVCLISEVEYELVVDNLGVQSKEMLWRKQMILSEKKGYVRPTKGRTPTGKEGK